MPSLSSNDLKRVTTLLLLCLYATSVSAQTRPTASDLHARAKRVLQTPSATFGSYTVVESDSVKAMCADKGVDVNELRIPADEVKTKVEKVTQSYKGPRDMFQLAMSTQVYSNIKIGEAVNSVVAPVGTPFVFAILAMGSFFFLFFWAVCSSCCKKTCCMKPLQEGDPRTKAQTCIFISSIVIGLALIATTIAWCILISSAVSGLKAFPCAITVFVSDVTNGYVDSNIKFIGIKGIKSMLAEVNNAITKFKSTDVTALNSALKTDGASLQSDVSAFANNNKPNSTAGLTYKMNASPNSEPDSIKALDNVIGSGLKAEVDILANIGSSFAEAGKVIKDLQTNGDSMTGSFNSLQSSLDSFNDQLETVNKAITSDLPISTLQSSMKTSLILVIIIVLVMTIFYFVGLYLNQIKNKWHWMKCLNKLFMLIQILLAVALGAAAGFFAIICILFSNVCYFLMMATTDKTFAATIQQKDFNMVFENCVLPGGSGNFKDFLNVGDTQTQIDNFNKTTQAMFVADDLATNFTSTSDPYVGLKIKTDYASRQACNVEDLAGNTPESWTDQITAINNILVSPQKNIAGLTCPASYQISLSTDAVNLKADITDQYCLKACSLNAGPFATRYNSNTGISTGDKATAGAKLDKLSSLGTTYTNKMASFFSGYNTLYNKEKAYFANIKTGYAKIQQLKTDTQALVNFLNSFAGNLFSALDCRILEREIRTFEVALCIKFTDKAMSQTSALIILDIMLFLFAWCICCGIRCSPARDPSNLAKPISSQPTTPTPPTMNMQPQGFAGQGQVHPYPPAGAPRQMPMGQPPTGAGKIGYL